MRELHEREGKIASGVCTHTELSEKATDNNLVEAPSSWMWIVCGCSAWRRDILQAFHSASLLDVVR